jgi:hypothetical protein
MELLKTNATLEYEKYNVEASYNTALKSLEKADEELTLLAKQILAADKANEIADQNLLMAKAQLIEQRAKVQKQYGVVDGYQLNLGFNNGEKYRYITVNGIGDMYRVNANGSMLLSEPEVIAYNATNPAIPYEYGVTTTIDHSKAEKAIITESIQVGSILSNTATEGAIDKQIKGYDLINYKDVLKTMDERAALMQNAKISENPNEKMARLALIKALTAGVSDMPVTLESTVVTTTP